MGIKNKLIKNSKLVEQAKRMNSINQSIDDELKEIKIAYNNLATKINNDMHVFNNKIEKILKLLGEKNVAK
ncbi:MAG: hypothetical protein ACOC80_00715 [Petrotogales bacterium]